MEQEDLQEAIEECRDNGNTTDLAYNEMMTQKLGVNELIKRFDIATGYAEGDA